MKETTVTLLLAITASLLFYLTWAKNTACISANGSIKQITCGGTDITNQLRYRNNYKKCDCIPLDSCANITITARWIPDRFQSRPGIELCQTNGPAVYRNWFCRTPTREKRLKSSRKNSTNVWQPAQKAPKSKRCHKIKTLPCRTPMFWNAGLDAPVVNCILQQCDEKCTSCAVAGPGSCDPGMCIHGSGEHVYTNETRCNHRCRIDMLVWGWRDNITTTGIGYMKLTDLDTSSVDIINANEPGYYLAQMDMNQCVFTDKNYSPWVPSVQQINLPLGKLVEWIERDMATLKNRLAAVLQVGGIDPSRVDLSANEWYSGAPYAEIYRLGNEEGARPLFTSTGNRNCSISAVFEGFNNGPTTLESYRVNIPGPTVNANDGC